MSTITSESPIFHRARLRALLEDRQMAARNPHAAAAELHRRRSNYGPLPVPPETDPESPYYDAADAASYAAVAREFNDRCQDLAERGLDITPETLGYQPRLLPDIREDLDESECIFLTEVIVAEPGYCHQLQAIVALITLLAMLAMLSTATAELAEPEADSVAEAEHRSGAPPGHARSARRHQLALSCRAATSRGPAHHGSPRGTHPMGSSPSKAGSPLS